MEKSHTEDVVVVVVPLPSQSHLNQSLHLSNLISSYGLPVHYIGSATHNRQAKLRSNGLKPTQIHFHELPIPPFETPDPNPNTFDKLPQQIAPALLAYLQLKQPLASFLLQLSKNRKRLVIIHDMLMSEAVADAAAIPNAEFYAFSCLSACNMFYITWEFMGKPFIAERVPLVDSVKEFFPEYVFQFTASRNENFKNRVGDIYNSTRLIEGEYIDLLSREEIGGKDKQWAINPSLPAIKFKIKNYYKTEDKCLEWLDKQEPGSVVYVAFGTCVSLSDEEVREIAFGLEESKVKFIWVVRDADRADIFVREERRIELPEGFEERTGENGMVVRGWAPQLEILAHKSVGGFMSHCGWNSCLESIATGVPVAAWPMHSDQPINALFLTEVLKVGVLVRGWEQMNEIVKAERIKNAIERLMGSEEGREVKKRAEEMSGALDRTVEEGGDFWKEVESFIGYITR